MSRAGVKSAAMRLHPAVSQSVEQETLRPVGDFHLLQLVFSVLVSALILQHHWLDDRKKQMTQLFTKFLLCGVLSNSKQKASSTKLSVLCTRTKLSVYKTHSVNKKILVFS